MRRRPFIRPLHPEGALRNLITGDTDEAASPDPLARLAAAADDLQVDPGLVWMSAELASLEPDLNEEERLAASLLVFTLWLTIGEGSTFLPLDGEHLNVQLHRLEEATKKKEKKEKEKKKDEVSPIDAVALGAQIRQLIEAQRLRHIIGTGDDFRPLILQDDRLYLDRILRVESSLNMLLGTRLEAQVPEDGLDLTKLDDALNEVLSIPAFEVESEQRTALEHAARRSTTVITGGPGTGKTTIIVSLLRLMVRLGMSPDEIALAAPTGKAANRMWESIRESMANRRDAPGAEELDKRILGGMEAPQTLHRLLGYSPYFDRFKHDHDSPLRARLIVVDEASMIDLFLMRSLVDAIAPDARLVFLGDVDQLPSVGTGATFRDLVGHTGTHDDMPAHVARLVKSHRMRDDNPGGSNILEVAGVVNTATEEAEAQLFGATPLIRARATPDELAYVGVEHVDESVALKDFVEAWYGEHILRGDEARATFHHTEDAGFSAESHERIKALFEHYAMARILCLTRVWKTGSNAINRTMHELFLETHKESEFGKSMRVRSGEPVMMLQNDYDLDVFNGDQGIALRTQRPDEKQSRQRIVFPRRDGSYRAVDVDRIRDRIDLSYAMTVHKSQGSEFRHVALVLPEKKTPLLTREILYTAITRASESVTVVGSRSSFLEGAKQPVVRFTAAACQRAQHLLPEPT